MWARRRNTVYVDFVLVAMRKGLLLKQRIADGSDDCSQLPEVRLTITLSL